MEIISLKTNCARGNRPWLTEGKRGVEPQKLLLQGHRLDSCLSAELEGIVWRIHALQRANTSRCCVLVPTGKSWASSVRYGNVCLYCGFQQEAHGVAASRLFVMRSSQTFMGQDWVLVKGANSRCAYPLIWKWPHVDLLCPQEPYFSTCQASHVGRSNVEDLKWEA